MFFPQDPFVQKPHLILGVKPVPAAVHDRETGVVFSAKPLMVLLIFVMDEFLCFWTPSARMALIL